MHLNTKLLFEKYATSYFKDGIRVLEIGPDVIPSPFKLYINNPSIQWHTLNLADEHSNDDKGDNPITYLSKDEYNYPIDTDVYDIVISSNVMEHVKKIWTWFNELKRITKPNGVIITIAPLSWPYHEAPVDCWRVFPEGIKALYDEVDLENVFSTFESLETELYKNQPYTPLLPGISTPQHVNTNLIKYWNRLVSLLPHSTPVRAKILVAYDLISIARKISNQIIKINYIHTLRDKSATKKRDGKTF